MRMSLRKNNQASKMSNDSHFSKLPKIEIISAKQKMSMNNLYMGKSSKGKSDQIIRTRDDESSLKQMLSQIEFTKPFVIETSGDQTRKLKRQQDYNSMFINIPSSPSQNCKKKIGSRQIVSPNSRHQRGMQQRYFNDHFERKTMPFHNFSTG